MSDAEDRLADLDEVIASGIVEVETADGKRVRYDTGSALLIRRKVAAAPLRRQRVKVGLYSPGGSGGGCE